MESAHPDIKHSDLRELTPTEIDRFCAEQLGQRPGQGLRVSVLLYREMLDTLDAMTSINRRFRKQLQDVCFLSRIAVQEVSRSADGTAKLLYRLEDDHTVEGVLIPGAGDRLTLCISTQVGCASGCRFCLSGADGLVRNLTVAELVNQVCEARRQTNGSITNLVLMGSGEPLGNYRAVRSFLEIATDRHGMGFSPRKVTLSTCGLAPMIEQLANDGVNASLAVSLHATDNAVRDRIMPINRIYPIERLMTALRYYTQKTGRTVTIEYALFRGVNDTPSDIRNLMAMLGGLPCMINILLFNPYPGCAFERPDEEDAFAMRDMLVNAGFVAVVRNSRGSDVNAACGQLRASAAKKQPARHQQ